MRRLLATVVAALALVGVAIATPAVATASPAATDCSGVWVVVESSVRCASDHSTGLAALRSVAAVETANGMVCRIDGAPATCVLQLNAYWSYWHAQRNADGSFGPWTYSTLGADQYRPARGDAEGWAFGAGTQAPGVLPPAAAPATPAASTAAATPAGPPATTPMGGPGGPTTAALALGALALGGAGVAWGVRRRRTP